MFDVGFCYVVLCLSFASVGARTLGVITKIDLMDHGTDCMDALSGKDYPLKLGMRLLFFSYNSFMSLLLFGDHIKMLRKV